jgi:amidase
VTGCGNPDWARTHGPADGTASCVAKLLAAGADLVGKTITDELAFSLMGENAHYGTPLNSAAPDRVPGGSSSGSASAVAGRACDLALGSDTGGSVRIPASNCGIYGIRTTHGRVALDRTMALAPSFDVVGWFARDPGLMRKAGAALFDAPQAAYAPTALLVATDLFAAADPAVQQALAPALDRVEQVVGSRRPVQVAPEGIERWFDAIRPLQGHEIWQVHGDWVRRTQPKFGPGVADRFRWVATITRDEVAAANQVRAQARARMAELLEGGAVLCLPTSPSPAPLKGLPLPDTDRFRARAILFTCVAGLAGLPQVSLPLGKVDGAPVGLSLIARPGADEMLLELAEKIGR